MFEVSSRGIVADHAITMKHTGLTEADAGKPVKITGNMTAGLCADGDAVFGVLQNVKPDACGVLREGVVTLPYTGAAPVPGFGQLSANGAGGVKVAAADNTGSLNYVILETDATAGTVTFILKH